MTQPICLDLPDLLEKCFSSSDSTRRMALVARANAGELMISMSR
jgi:hypothetical protein